MKYRYSSSFKENVILMHSKFINLLGLILLLTPYMHGQKAYVVTYERGPSHLNETIAALLGINDPNNPEVRQSNVRSTLLVDGDKVKFSDDSIRVLSWPSAHYVTEVAKLWYLNLKSDRALVFEQYKHPDRARVTEMGIEGGKWKLLEERRNILGHRCKKAILQDVNDVVHYEVWYAIEIPVSVGPYPDMHGVPGLVLSCVHMPRTLSIVSDAIHVKKLNDLDSRFNVNMPSNYVEVKKKYKKSAEARSDFKTGLYPGLIRYGVEDVGRGWIPFAMPAIE